MALLDMVRQPDRSAMTEVAESIATSNAADALQQAANNLELILESLADVELALEDRGWRALRLQSERQFTRDGLRRSAVLARTMAVVNPLIRRGLNIRAAYVWAGGVQIAARATGQDEKNTAEQDVNAVVQDFLDDKATKKVLTSASARQTNERTLGTDGMLALALFTSPVTGRVQPRRILTDEIVERIANPEDSTETWYWKRVWSETSVSPTGARSTESRTTYYPDVDYRPSTMGRMQAIGGAPIMWDAPLIMLTVNGLDGWDFGIGDAFSALPWARGYKEFLEDWARYMKSLSRFVWRLTSGSNSKATTAAAAIAAATKPVVLQADLSGTRNEAPVGGAAVGGPGMGTLEAIPKSGATLDSESGKPLASMVAAALEVPVTMLLGDPGHSGARAVAETLDRPTENMAVMRRDVWGDFYQQLLGYVVDQAVKAPRGGLKGTVTRDEWGREVVTLANDTERTITIDWPDLTATPLDLLMAAIVEADSTGWMPPVEVLKLMLNALGIKDIDEVVEAATDADGNLTNHKTSAGDEAVKRFNQGDDPTDTLN